MNKHSWMLLGQQLLAKRRTILVWVIVWSVMTLLFVSVFNDLSKTAADSFKLYESLPPALLKAVNISGDYLTRVEKFLSGQFLTVYLLAGGIFSIFMGVGAIGARIEDATIAQVLTKPISRSAIYVTQSLTSVLALFSANALVGLVMYGLFSLRANQADISESYFVAAFLGAGCLFITLSIVGQLLGTWLSKSHATASGAALVVFSFFVNGLGELAGIPSWLQHLSLFHYFNTVQLRDMYTLDIPRLTVLIAVSAVVLLVGMLWFRRKDIYL